MSWILLSLIAPLLYSFTNYLEKFLIDKKIKNPLNLVILGGILSFFISLLIFLIHGFVLLNITQILILIISGILGLFYLIPYFKALALDDASRVIPLFQFLSIFVLILSYFLLHEQLSQFQLLSFIFILTGGILLSLEKSPEGIFRQRKSFWYMMLACLLASGISILFKYAHVPNDYWLSFAYQELGGMFGAIILLLVPRLRRSFFLEIRTFQKNVWLFLSLDEILDRLAGFVYLYASLLAPVALVAVVTDVQPFFVLVEGIILSVWFPHIIKEDLSRKTLGIKIISILLIFMGIYILSTK